MIVNKWYSIYFACLYIFNPVWWYKLRFNTKMLNGWAALSLYNAIYLNFLCKAPLWFLLFVLLDVWAVIEIVFSYRCILYIPLYGKIYLTIEHSGSLNRLSFRVTHYRIYSKKCYSTLTSRLLLYTKPLRCENECVALTKKCKKISTWFYFKWITYRIRCEILICNNNPEYIFSIREFVAYITMRYYYFFHRYWGQS